MLNTANCGGMFSNVDLYSFFAKVLDPMTLARRKLVNEVFDSLDNQHQGYLIIDDLLNEFNAKNHPEVKTGKKSEQEVRKDFLETFDLHHQISLNDQTPKDRKVSRNEFLGYYRICGTGITDDIYFEKLVAGPWIKGN